MKYRNEWLLYWRRLGHVDANGSWVAPVSYVEAGAIPSKKLDVFLTLDDIVSKTAKQKIGKGKNGR